jgi:two-component system OmpR family sensor kinase
LTISITTIVAAQFWIYIQSKHEKEIREGQNNASNDRRRFLQRLDHELKNPLTAIQAGLTNMTYEPLEDYLANEVSAVQVQVLRISRLIADLRKLAALEKTPLETTIVNMADLLTEVVNVVKDQANMEDRQLTLILPNAPWPLPDVKGDPDLLLLAIHNLLDNAVKFTSPGDTIEVRAFDDGNDIVIEVADTGPGIPEIEIDRVWEELYRGEHARSVPGTGLGLPLVQAIIEQHHGTVGLRSRPDQGTVFSVRLPAK